jgi:hypothetical protein
LMSMLLTIGKGRGMAEEPICWYMTSPIHNPNVLESIRDWGPG